MPKTLSGNPQSNRADFCSHRGHRSHKGFMGFIFCLYCLNIRVEKRSDNMGVLTRRGGTAVKERWGGRCGEKEGRKMESGKIRRNICFWRCCWTEFNNLDNTCSLISLIITVQLSLSGVVQSTKDQDVLTPTHLNTAASSVTTKASNYDALLTSLERSAAVMYMCITRCA